MKAVFVVILLAAVILGGVYLFLGYKSFDPSKQGREAKAAIKPGMTWHEVLRITGDGAKYQHISKQREKSVGSMTQVVGSDTEEGFVLVAEPKAPFDRAQLDARLANGEEPYGFILSYLYSNAVAFAIRFDQTGVVTDVRDEATMADLLQLK